MKSPDCDKISKMTELPNIGKAISADLEKVGLTHPKQLIGKNAYDLYQQHCFRLGSKQEHCIIDVFFYRPYLIWKVASRFLGGTSQKKENLI